MGLWIVMLAVFAVSLLVACVLFRTKRIGFWSFVLIPLTSVFAVVLAIAILILLSGDM